MRILVPNATTPRNIGDLAMLEVLLGLLKKEFPDSHLTLHIGEPALFHLKGANVVRQNIYTWLMFPNTQWYLRLYKLMQLTVAYCYTRITNGVVGGGILATLFRDFKIADIIVFTGGGYLRSRAGFRESVTLLSLALVYILARLGSAKTIMMPISFGPFAYRWQERVFVTLLSKLNVVLVREDASLALLRKHGLGNVTVSEDLVFLSNTAPNEQPPSKPIIGLTLLDWFSGSKQEQFEHVITESLIMLALKNHVAIQPIVQVHGPKTGDRDLAVVQRVCALLERQGVEVLPVVVIQNVSEAKQVYARLALMLGMRMHSNVIAALVGVPFVALAYEHKTAGISKRLGMEDYCLESNKVTATALTQVLDSALENRVALRTQLLNRIREISAVESENLHSVFKELTKSLI